jgi:outer membrane lipoprotein-sorting protein
MKRFVLLSIVMLLLGNVFAMQDEKAENILKEVSEKTNSFESMSVDFHFTMENTEMDIHESNKGSIQLKGQKYLVNLPDLGIKYYSDGETIWNYMEDGNQVIISTMDDEGGELMNPSTLFNIHEKGFESKFIGEKIVAGKQLIEIELYPNEEEYDLLKVSLIIDKTEMTIHSAKLFGNDDNIYGIQITEIKTNVGLPDEYFDFNFEDYEDLEVIDFR